ncbi:hypothetical protein C9J98_06045 [Stenotrophomonas panacihumi]|nr:hypothetical protein C9J98_06045 [Stenotrophomonas panacihumi]
MRSPVAGRPRRGARQRRRARRFPARISVAEAAPPWAQSGRLPTPIRTAPPPTTQARCASAMRCGMRRACRSPHAPVADFVLPVARLRGCPTLA